jgi:dihydropteroate synthase
MDQSILQRRANEWKLRTRTLQFNSMPLIMGIVNVTPDSFSDGGKFSSQQSVIEHCLQLIADGADILDIGGESTRPYATPVDVNDELKRVVPVIEAIRGKSDIPISIDTSKSLVAREAIAAGAEIINDVTGLSGDPEMMNVARDSSAGVCAMHMQGTPQTMQDNPVYENIVSEIHEYLSLRRYALIKHGIDPVKICLDPGIGFGKTHEHNIELMANCWRFHDIGAPILVGHSRKGFIGKLLSDKERDRDAATAGASCALALQKVQVIRVHDVRATKDALRLFLALLG